MLGTGFTAILKVIWFPLEIPPRIPPALFVSKTGIPFSACILSLFWLPVRSAAANPAPNSIPFTAPIESIAFASSASSLSKTGSPSPAGQPFITHSTIPPALSQFLRSSSIFSSIFFAASLSGARMEFWSISERFIFSAFIPAAFNV